MAVELSATGTQIIQPGASVVFTANPVRCACGLVYWRPNTGLVRLASPSIINNCRCIQPFNCCGMLMADYDVGFHANIQLPEGGMAGETISLAIAIDGAVDPDSSMQTTPAAAEQPDNVGAGIIVSVPWICRCSSLQVVNTSTVPVEVINPNLTIDYSGIGRR
jgi:hypothetical protein